MFSSLNDEISNALPFHNLVDYDIETHFESSKRRIQELMSDHRLVKFLKEKKLSSLFNQEGNKPCEYYDEDEFTSPYEFKWK